MRKLLIPVLAALLAAALTATLSQADANDGRDTRRGVYEIGRTDGERSALRDPRTLLQDPDGDPATADEVADGFTNLLKTLREETIAFAKPVAFVHGDSHYFRIDKPLQDAKGDRIQWLTRVETPGNNQQSANNDVQWIKVKVEPRSPEVFTYEPQILRDNLSAYTP